MPRSLARRRVAALESELDACHAEIRRLRAAAAEYDAASAISAARAARAAPPTPPPRAPPEDLPTYAPSPRAPPATPLAPPPPLSPTPATPPPARDVWAGSMSARARCDLIDQIVLVRHWPYFAEDAAAAATGTAAAPEVLSTDWGALAAAASSPLSTGGYRGGVHGPSPRISTEFVVRVDQR